MVDGDVVVVGGGPLETTMSTELPGLTEVPAGGLDWITMSAAKLFDGADEMFPTTRPVLPEDVGGLGLGQTRQRRHPHIRRARGDGQGHRTALGDFGPRAADLPSAPSPRSGLLVWVTTVEVSPAAVSDAWAAGQRRTDEPLRYRDLLHGGHGQGDGVPLLHQGAPAGSVEITVPAASVEIWAVVLTTRPSWVSLDVAWATG